MPKHTAKQAKSGSLDDRKSSAFELACSAEETPDPVKRLQLALRAVRLDPCCLDARLILAEAAGGPKREYIEELHGIVALGRRQLRHRFAADRGNFWGVTETRPYMRARARLAEVLASAGRLQEAVQHYSEMLCLDGRDSMGNRYGLVGCLLEIGDLDGVRKLLGDDEVSSMYAWATVLERLLAQHLDEATTALEKARKLNGSAELLLSGRHRAPSELPLGYTPGDFSEAVFIYHTLGRAWKKHSNARKWLRSKDVTSTGLE